MNGYESVLVISKQPRMDVMTQNIGIILDNLFYNHVPIGNQLVLDDYEWLDKRVYSQINRGMKPGRTIDLAQLIGLKQPSGCIQFPLFVVNLMFHLIQGNVKDMTFVDNLKNSCNTDSGRLNANARLVWDQMAENVKKKEQFFTTTGILKRFAQSIRFAIY